MRKFLLATGTLLFAAAAQAADMPVKAPPVAVAAVYSWTGCYIGASGGGAWGRSRHVRTDGVPMTNRFDVDGWIVGGTVGCNLQNGAIVFGVEGDWSWTNKKGDTFLVPPFATTIGVETKEKWLATGRGRLGWAHGQWLFFATGGVAAADVSVTEFNPVGTSSESKTRWGWTVGGGIEAALSSNWSAKAEYLYVKFDDDKRYFTVSLCCAERRTELNNHIARVGLNYRFGASAIAARY